jgi:hypothetical protein
MSGLAIGRYLIRRLKRVMSRAKFLACFWMLGDDREKALVSA